MGKLAICLKIDFKIHETDGKLKIFDLGDGLSADTDGFPDNVIPTMMRHLYEASESSACATPFGELPRELMYPDTLHIPLVQRTVPPANGISNISDIVALQKYVLPFSGCRRTHPHLSYGWSKQSEHVVKASLSLIAMEMHKLLWYVLMQKHLHVADRDNMIFWENHTAPDTVDVSTIDITQGVFIKIVDRSTGGGGEVYYAKNVAEINQILRILHQNFRQNPAENKHIFVIEPAYITLLDEHNVTGRAFMTLSYDEDTQALGVKIAGANWIFPQDRLQKSPTESQMLANIKHSSKMRPLTEQQLGVLVKEIEGRYADVFKAALLHNDMMVYCSEYPIIASFQSCLRKNSFYPGLLAAFETIETSQQGLQAANTLASMINSLVYRDMLGSLDVCLRFTVAVEQVRFFPSGIAKTQMDALLTAICNLSFFEKYAQFVKTCDDFIRIPAFAIFLSKETAITVKLDLLIKQYLSLKDQKYDTHDLNRALRQAAGTADLAALKILLYTRRAEVNAFSPKSNQTALDFALKSEVEPLLKKQCIDLLEQAGAHTALPVQAADIPVSLDCK